MTMSTTRYQRTTGQARDVLVRQVVRAYSKGDSVRAIAETYGMSYGKAHKLLAEAGVEFRPRGGAGKRRKAGSK